nr:hypothetical protein [Tanacetum cinerariifolium]
MDASEVPEMDPYEEDPKEDTIDYVADADDDDDEEEESSEDDDDEEEEHLAPADYIAITSPAVDHVPSAEETKPFEIDESAATPPPPHTYGTTSRMYVRTQTPLLFPSEAEIPSPALHVPSPPTTSPTYTETPLGYKATRIRLRAISPLPSSTPPPPLLLPSTTHRADIFKANILPRKRLLLTAPIPRFEVGESFVAAARQPRSTMVRRVDYNFVDTVDASIWASKRRTMAAIEVVNLRRDRAALPDEVDTLRGYLSSLCTTHEQERVEACQDLDRYEAHNRALEARIKMPPKRNAAATTTTPMTDAQMKALIAPRVADALAERDAYRSWNDDDSHDSGSDGRRRMHVARECTYNDFLKCQPFNFKGTEGVVGLTQWNTLTWWNSHVKSVGHDVAYGMSWKTLMKMMTDKYCPK